MKLTYKQQIVAQMVRDGQSKDEIAEYLGISATSYYRWRAEDPDYRQHLLDLAGADKRATQMFDGQPETHEEVMRRAGILLRER